MNIGILDFVMVSYPNLFPSIHISLQQYSISSGNGSMFIIISTYQIIIIRIKRAHSHGLKKLDRILNQILLNNLPIPLLINQLNNRILRTNLDVLINMRLKCSQPSLTQSRQTMVLNIKPIQICEKSAVPSIHNRVVVPSKLELFQKWHASRDPFCADGGQDCTFEVGLDRFTVFSVERL